MLSLSDNFCEVAAGAQNGNRQFHKDGLQPSQRKETCVELRRFGRYEFVIGRAIGALMLSMIALLSVNGQGITTPQAGGSAPAKVGRRLTSSLLPTSTRFWVSVEDLRRLETNISNTQIGRLSRQDTLAPFFASFETQLRDALNKNGIKFGLDIASVEQLQTGEVAIAGVLPDFGAGEKPIPGSHGIVVLIDVSPDLLAAEDFLSDAAGKMKKRGAKLEEIKVFETEVSKWTIEVKAAKVGRTQKSFITIVDGWVLASDNESIFSNVLRRIKSKEKAPGDSLSGYEPFTTVKAKTKVEGVRPDVEWFVDPLGYARFADALAEEQSDIRQPKDRPLETLSKEGLDALKAAGGFISFSTGEQDVLHRALVYANKKKAVDAAQKRLFNLLDFAPAGSSAAQPPAWVPDDAAGYFTGTWDVNKAFENLGPMFDAISNKEGMLDSVLDEMKKVPDFKVDIRKMVQSVGNRATVVAMTEEPISESSEKMIIGINLKPGVDAEWMIQSIGRATKGKVKKLAGYTAVIDDDTEVEPEEDIPGLDGLDDLDEFEDLDDELDADEDDDEDDVTPRITILNRRIMVIRDGVLLICNDKDYLKKFLSMKPNGKFPSSADYSRMSAQMDKLTNPRDVRFRMFNRLDRMLKTNYEMMRMGKMAESETFLARILNQVYGKKTGDPEKRKQKIDGSDLPADFEKEMAPFLGQSGWAMETTEFGWRFSGCVLAKEGGEAKVSEAAKSSK